MTAPRQPGPRTNPRTFPPDRDPRLHDNRAPERSLTESMQPVVDMARQITVDLGLRPYTVHSVVLCWSGGEVGKGSPRCEKETAFVPTPLVDLQPVQQVTTPAGTTDRGIVNISEISARFSEDDIQNLFHVQPLGPDREGFIEIRHDRRDGDTKRRRFRVMGVPWHDAENFMWRARMVAQDGGRTRAGDPSDVRSPNLFVPPGRKVLQ